MLSIRNTLLIIEGKIGGWPSLGCICPLNDSHQSLQNTNTGNSFSPFCSDNPGNPISYIVSWLGAYQNFFEAGLQIVGRSPWGALYKSGLCSHLPVGRADLMSSTQCLAVKPSWLVFISLHKIGFWPSSGFRMQPLWVCPTLSNPGSNLLAESIAPAPGLTVVR